MTIRKNSLDGPNSTTITPANSASYGDAFTGVIGSPVYSTTTPAHGSGAMLINNPGTGTHYAYWSGLSETDALFVGAVRISANPAADMTVLSTAVSSGNAATVTVRTSGRLTSFNGVNLTTTDPIALDTWYRWELLVTAASKRFAVYPIDSSTAVYDSGVQATTMGTVTSVRYGKYSTDSYTGALRVDDVTLRTGVDATWGPYPYAEPLPNPVISVTGQTNPSTYGGSDGTITVTWPTVSGAHHYEAGIADGAGQTDLIVVDADATSPHTFSGLTAGTRTVGIRAKAS